MGSVKVIIEKNGSCTTNPTNEDGTRNPCSICVQYDADPGRFVKRNSVEVREDDGRGSEYGCGTTQ